MQLQLAGRRIDSKRAGEMLVAGNARPAGARHHIAKAPRRMRPQILDIRRQRDRRALGQALRRRCRDRTASAPGRRWRKIPSWACVPGSVACSACAAVAPRAVASSHRSDAVAKRRSRRLWRGRYSACRLCALELLDQRLDARDGAEVRRRHIAVGNLQIELGFDREHEIDHVERRDAAVGQNVVAADRARRSRAFPGWRARAR